MTPARHSKGRRAGNICRYAYTLPQGGGGGGGGMYVCGLWKGVKR
jgi:hypothetical protein